MNAMMARLILLHLIRRSPQASGQSGSRRSLAKLRQALSWLRGLSLAGVSGILRRLGIRYKRGRQSVHSPDPDYDLKLAVVAAARRYVDQHPQRYVMVYQDEFTYYRRASVTRAYASAGHDQARAHMGYRANNKRRICAVLDVRDGRLIAQQRARFNRFALLRFYHHLESLYPEAALIFVVQDNWPVHFHPDVLQALAHSKIVLLPLPTYAPWTNPIEDVWRLLFKDVLHHHPFTDQWLLLQHAVLDWLDQWKDGSLDLLHAVGLYPY